MKVRNVLLGIALMLIAGCQPVTPSVGTTAQSPVPATVTPRLPVTNPAISMPTFVASLPAPTPTQPLAKRIKGTMVVVSYQVSGVSTQTLSIGASNLVLVDLTSGTITQLTSGAYRDRDPRWSPDGRVIAFSSNRSGRFEIFTIGRDGNDLTHITSSEGNKFNPAWSPDGERLAFVVMGETKEKIPEYTAIDILELKTLTTTRLLQIPWEIDGPAILSIDWSPVDKDLVLYASSEPSVSRVYLLDLQTKTSTLLSPEGWTCAVPRWSPDGSLVLMEGCSIIGAEATSPMVGTLIEQSGGFGLTKKHFLEGLRVLVGMSWSPDGTMWVGTASKKDGTTEVLVYDARGYIESTTHPLPQPFHEITGGGAYIPHIYKLDSKEVSYSQPDWQW